MSGSVPTKLQLLFLAAAAICITPLAVTADEAAPTVDFRRDVYPLLSSKCFQCHQGADASSGYRLDDRAELLGETTGQPLVQPGVSAHSKLIKVVESLDDETRMPPDGKQLTREQIATLRVWIDEGISWDESLLPPITSGTTHWAFQPIRRPQVPQGHGSTWVQNEVDAFVAAQHQRLGLTSSPPASRRTLIRRLSFDLRGIPPTTSELQRFLDDNSPDAWSQLIERMLASPHYGEHWGRHWLDVARWSESEGFESNHPRPFAWRYRDYVVDSFNRDQPYDTFVRQQLAGDELQPYTDQNLIATGFLAAARISSNEEDKWLQRNMVLVDIVNATSSALLGLTIHCAQCHNHKFDPITLRDYYRLQGYFLGGQPMNVALRSPELQRQYRQQCPPEYEPARELKEAIFRAAADRFNTQVRQKLSAPELQAIDTPFDERTPEQELLARKVDLRFQKTPMGIEKYIPEDDQPLYRELAKKLQRIEKHSVVPQTFAFYSPVTSPHDCHVLPSVGFYPLPWEPQELARYRPYLRIRGEVHSIGPVVAAGVPEVLENTALRNTPPKGEKPQPGTRSELANWLVDGRHPLTARVWVNRIWHYHFGRGLVSTPSDFGVRGAPPTHPELLDWLASELMQNGWSTKHIHRLILQSSTWQQTSELDSQRSEIQHNLQLDAENRFLWHWQPRRLEAESIRDAMLAVSGELDLSLGGVSVPSDQSQLSTRRSLYLFQKRGLPPTMQKLFDGPAEAAESCSRRHTSTTALQSLFLLNNEFVLRCADRLADRARAAAPEDQQQQIQSLFLLTLGRPPEPAELNRAQKLLDAVELPVVAQIPETKQAATSPLTQLATALMNINEFLFLQ